ncbi:MAG: DUF4276 family protein [Acidimicrobiales bacterium]
MTPSFVVAPIVEGHGEVAALPALLRRMVPEIDPDRPVAVRPPIRMGRGLVARANELERRVDLAARRVKADGGAVLVLFDGDDDCAATLGPALQHRVQECRPDVPSAAVIAVREFEAWYLASAQSLAGRRGLPPDLAAPSDAEAVRDAKGWLQERRTDGLAYSPTIDQPALAGLFDMAAARSHAPSFDKLWREIERLLVETA